MITRTIPASSFPKRKKPVKSGIERAPQRVWLRHRRWVRSLECCVPYCDTPWGAEFAHIRSAANAGVALKPHDASGVPLCRRHHAEQHQIGQRSFEDKYHIDLTALADELVRRSPDRKMYMALLEATLDTPANPLGLIPIINNPGEAFPHADTDARRKSPDDGLADPGQRNTRSAGHDGPGLRVAASRDQEGLSGPPASGRTGAGLAAQIEGPAQSRGAVLAGAELAHRGEGPELALELSAIWACPTKRARDSEAGRLHALLLWRGLVEEDIGDFIRITEAGRAALRAIAVARRVA